MFGLEESELMERRRYVNFVGREIDVRDYTLCSYLQINYMHFPQGQSIRAELESEAPQVRTRGVH
jgi:hypothetical protein